MPAASNVPSGEKPRERTGWGAGQLTMGLCALESHILWTTKYRNLHRVGGVAVHAVTTPTLSRDEGVPLYPHFRNNTSPPNTGHAEMLMPASCQGAQLVG